MIELGFFHTNFVQFLQGWFAKNKINYIFQTILNVVCALKSFKSRYSYKKSLYCEVKQVKVQNQ